MHRLSGLVSTLLGVGAVVAALLWLRSDRGPEESGPGRRPYVLPVTTVAVERGDLVPRAELVGSVRSPSTADLAFQRPGRLVELTVRDGDRVSADQALARLDPAQETLALAEAQADLDLARSELLRVQAGEREETLARLRAERDERQAVRDLAQLEVQRGKALVENHLSRSDQDRREAELAQAEARAAAAESSLALAEAGSRIEDIEVAKARVSVAEAALARRQKELANMVLTAGRPAVVVRRLAAPGDYLSAGQAVVQVVDVEDLEVELEVPSSYAQRLGDEPRVRLRSDELPDFAWEGAIDALVPVADPSTRNFRALVRLAVEEPLTAQLRPGQFLRATLLLEPQRGVLIAPMDAVRRRGGRAEVVRVQDGPAGEDGRPSASAELVAVHVLASDGVNGALQAIDGAQALQAGDRLVLRGVGLAFAGASLLVRDDLNQAGPQ